MSRERSVAGVSLSDVAGLRDQLDVRAQRGQRRAELVAGVRYQLPLAVLGGGQGDASIC